MKASLFVLLLILIYSCTTPPEKSRDSTEGRVLETEYAFSNGGWHAIRKIRYSYTDFNKEEHRIITVSKDYSTWENSSKFYISYNNNQDMSFTERSIWQDEKWRKVFSSTYSYTDDLISSRTDSAFLATGEINIMVNTYSYNDQELVTEELAERVYDEEKVLASRLIHSYSDDDLVVEKNWQRYEDGGWINLRRIVFIYDEELNHVGTIRQNWQENEWKNSIKYLLTVNDEDKRTGALWQRYSEDSWQDFRKVTYEY